MSNTVSTLTEELDPSMCASSKQMDNPTFVEYFSDLFSTEMWPDRWHCGSWSEVDGWIMIGADIGIFVSYFAIPIFLLWYLRKKSIGNLKWIVGLFAAFILFCGLTHLVDALIFWQPIYRFLGLIKLITAATSVVTAVVLAKVLPIGLKYKSPREMQEEIDHRTRIQNQLELFIQHSPGAIAMFDKDMKYLITNSNWLKDYGLKHENIVGKSHYEIFPEILDMPQWLEDHRRALAGETLTKKADKFTTENGTSYIDWEICPWSKANGEIGGMIMFTRVITEEYLTKQKLNQEKKKRLRNSKRLMEVCDTAKIGFWNVELDSPTVNWSNTVYDIHKIKKGEEINVETAIDYYHKDHQIIVKKLVDNALNKRESYDEELLLINGDGEEVWVRAIGKPVVNKNNAVTGLEGLFLDINRRKKSEIEIKQLNATLEDRITEALKEVKKSHQYVIESEKMASLGQLIGGIGHEINTPLGAINASAEQMHETNIKLTEKLNTISNVVLPELYKQFKSFLDDCIKQDYWLSTKLERQAKKNLKKGFEDIDIPNKQKVIDLLIQMRFYKDWERHIPFYSLPNNLELLDIILLLSKQYRCTETIIYATEKSRKTVYALKSFSRIDHNEKPVVSDLKKEIDNTLVLYENQLKQGIVVKQEHPAHPVEIEAYVDSLNQVWSNLIQNAIHAMKLNGELKISIHSKEKHVHVLIEDTGAGIPIENHKKIFAPFFTTKDKDNGSGLGLDIVKKVIDKHLGEITFDSRPGKTVFKVILPKSLQN